MVLEYTFKCERLTFHVAAVSQDDAWRRYKIRLQAYLIQRLPSTVKPTTLYDLVEQAATASKMEYAFDPVTNTIVKVFKRCNTGAFAKA